MVRPLTLTAAHVARVPRYDGPSLEFASAGKLASEAQLIALRDRLLDEAPPDGLWVFAYGSLIWNPGVPVDGDELGRVAGWHRRFCLGWMTAFRGSPDRPGLMLALDRGGSCRGVALRLARETAGDSLLALLRRELPFARSGQQPRWVGVDTAAGPRRALAFAVDRRSGAYVGGLDEAAVVAMLATSAGDRGNMAEYLLATVEHLAARGIEDGYLWRLQAGLARVLEAP